MAIDLTANCVAQYHMNEASWNGTPNEVADSSGNGWHGEADGDADTITGGIQGSRCGRFNGTGDYVDLPDITTIDGLDEFSVSLWANAFSCDQDGYLIDRWSSQLLVYADYATYNNWRAIMRNSNGDTYGSGVNLQNDAEIIFDTWAHLVLRFRRNDYFRFYVNNNLIIEQATADYPMASASGIIRIGADRDNGNDKEFEGDIDELVFFNKALTPPEVAWLYNNGKGRESLKQLLAPLFQRHYRNRRNA